MPDYAQMALDSALGPPVQNAADLAWQGFAQQFPAVAAHREQSEQLPQWLSLAAQGEARGLVREGSFDESRLGREWPTVERDMRNRFPALDPAHYREAYLATARAAFRQQQAAEARARNQEPTWAEARDLILEGLPFVGTLGRVGGERVYNEAAGRIGQGQGTQADYDLAGRFQAEQQHQRRIGETFPGLTLQVLHGALPFVAEMVLTGGTAATAREAVAERLAAAIGTNAADNIVSRIGGFAAHAATQSALSPSLGVAQSQQMADQRGGEWYSPGNLGRGLPAGALQAGIFDLVGYPGGLPGQTLGRHVVAPIVGAQVSNVALQQLGLAPTSGSAENLSTPEGLRHLAAEALAFGLIGAYSHGAERLGERVNRRADVAPSVARDVARQPIPEPPIPEARLLHPQPENAPPRALWPREPGAPNVTPEPAAPRTSSPITPQEAQARLQAEAQRLGQAGEPRPTTIGAQNLGSRPAEAPGGPPAAPAPPEGPGPSEQPPAAPGVAPGGPPPTGQPSAVNARIEALRQRQARQGTVATPEPRPLKELPRVEQRPAAEQLREQLEAAGLSPQEQHVLVEARQGRTYDAIAQDEVMRKPDGGVYTRERIRQIEAQARGKIREVTGAELPPGPKAGPQVERPTGREVPFAELHPGPESPPAEDVARIRDLTRLDADISGVADQWIREREAGTLTPEKEAQYTAEVQRLHAERLRREHSQEISDAEQAGRAEGLSQDAVQRQVEETLQQGLRHGLAAEPAAAADQGAAAPGGEAAGAPAAPAAVPGAAGAGPAAGPTGIERARRGRAWVKEIAAQARAEGIPEDWVHAAAREVLGESQQAAAGHNALVDDVKRVLLSHNPGMSRQGLDRVIRGWREQGGDWGKFRGMDVVDAEVDGPHQQVLRSMMEHTGRSVEQVVFDLLTEGKRKPTGEQAAYEQALERLGPEARRQAQEAVLDEIPFQRGADLRPPRQRPAGRTPPVESPPRPETVAESLRSALAPATRGEHARAGAGVLRENLARLARKTAVAEAALAQGKDHFERTMAGLEGPARAAKFLEFTDAVEGGRLDTLPAEVRPIAETVRRLIDERTEQLRSREMLQNFIDNYLGHLWKKGGQAGGPDAGGEMARLARRPLAGPEGFKKKRSIPTYREGVEAGLEPVSWNPVEAALLNLREMDKSLMGHDVVAELAQKGLRQFRRLGRSPGEGWATVEDKSSKVFAPPEVKVKEYFDKKQMEALENFARSLGIRLERPTGGPPGMANLTRDRITTRFGTGEETLAHEIGHFLDRRYNMQDWLRDDLVARELKALADLRAAGRVSPEAQAYLRSPPEQMANLVAAYIHAPELAWREAPNATARLDNLLATRPELKALREAKPSLVLGEREQMLRLAGPMLVGQYYYPEPVAKLLNNYLSPGLYGRSRLYDVTRGFANLMNQAQLGFSAFHAGFELMDSMVSQVALSLQMLSRGQLGPAARMFATAPAAPVRNLLEGNRISREYFAPGSQGAEMGALIQSLQEGGGRARMDAFYGGDAVSRLRQALREVWAGKASSTKDVLLQALPALTEAVSKPVMEWMVPRMKLGVFADMARYELERLGPEATLEQRREALGGAWDSVENRLGQLTYDNLFWKRTGKDLALLGIRSTGWNVGTWRELGGGVLDVPASLQGLAQGQGISRRTAYVIALPLVTAFWGAVYGYLFGKRPEELKDYFFPRTGRTRPDGTADRVSLPSYMRDVAALTNRADEGPTRWAQNAFQMAGHKLNPAVATVREMLSNEDFYGTAIRNPNDPWVRQSRDTALHLAQAFEPFAVRSFRQQRQTGAGVLPSAQGFLGVTPAPGYVTRTAQQQRDRETGRRIELTPQERLRRQRMGLR